MREMYNYVHVYVPRNCNLATQESLAIHQRNLNYVRLPSHFPAHSRLQQKLQAVAVQATGDVELAEVTGVGLLVLAKRDVLDDG